MDVLQEMTSSSVQWSSGVPSWVLSRCSKQTRCRSVHCIWSEAAAATVVCSVKVSGIVEGETQKALRTPRTQSYAGFRYTELSQVFCSSICWCVIVLVSASQRRRLQGSCRAHAAGPIWVAVYQLRSTITRSCGAPDHLEGRGGGVARQAST